MCLSCLYFPFPCVYREEDTPSSIPNLAVKLLFADDTALCKCGNVGRCRDWGNVYLTHKILLYLLFIVFYLTLFLSCLVLLQLDCKNLLIQSKCLWKRWLWVEKQLKNLKTLHKNNFLKTPLKLPKNNSKIAKKMISRAIENNKQPLVDF